MAVGDGDSDGQRQPVTHSGSWIEFATRPKLSHPKTPTQFLSRAKEGESEPEWWRRCLRRREGEIDAAGELKLDSIGPNLDPLCLPRPLTTETITTRAEEESSTVATAAGEWISSNFDTTAVATEEENIRAAAVTPETLANLNPTQWAQLALIMGP